jgi:glucose-6-phosphate isomerase
VPFAYRKRRNSADSSWRNTDRVDASSRVAALTDVTEPERFVIDVADLHIDLSRNFISRHLVEALVQDFGSRVTGLRDSMLAGEAINTTENRKVLHVALRDSLLGSAESVEANAVLNQMAGFAEGVRTGKIRGTTGLQFTHVVNIGIGGSDLGPAMAYDALSNFNSETPGLEVRFVSNIDPELLDSAMRGLDPLSTLVVVVSKTFTTTETISNFQRIKALLAMRSPGVDLNEHFVAVTANVGEAMRHGVNNVLPMWDWVGGRYSIGSAVGLALMLAIGADEFREMLAGMHEIDSHFSNAPLTENAPFLLGALDTYYSRHFGMHSRAVVPYSSALRMFPAYLQQLEMESNGKRVDRDGKEVLRSAVPVWGGAGTDGQHAYFQFLHQGTEFVPVDFIGFAQTRSTSYGSKEAHEVLIANMVAQIEALTTGTTVAADGKVDSHRAYPGNRPTNVVLAPNLSARVLGQLIALYEHRVFVQGAIWNLNSFDQWGVELGKGIAESIVGELRELKEGANGHSDSSVAGTKKPSAISQNLVLKWFKSQLH